jgi:MFS superfamily sulfate permease-like transporter
MKNIKSNSLPADRLEGLKKHWKTDLLSGFTVFMVALPLCLGISLASGVPPLAGIIAAIVGGIVVSQISGSYVTINGPAAGLIVVVLGAVEAIGEGDMVAGYKGMIAAVVVSGLLLFFLGKLKAGRFADFFPLSAVHGMLAAIGVIIIAKQIHVMLGVKPESKEILGLIAEIPKSISLANPEIAIIGLVSLGILIALPMLNIKWLKALPAPMIVVVAGMIMGHLFDVEDLHTYSFFNHAFELGPKFLVTLPAKFIDWIVFPDFTVVTKSAFWIAVVTITLVQGLETLLSTKE